MQAEGELKYRTHKDKAGVNDGFAEDNGKIGSMCTSNHTNRT